MCGIIAPNRGQSIVDGWSQSGRYPDSRQVGQMRDTSSRSVWRRLRELLGEGLTRCELLRAESFTLWMPTRDDPRGNDRL